MPNPKMFHSFNTVSYINTVSCSLKSTFSSEISLQGFNKLFQAIEAGKLGQEACILWQIAKSLLSFLMSA